MDILTLIGSYAFPIVACVAMGLYVKDTTDAHRKDVAELNKQHRDEMAEITKAINNNTIAIETLCERMTVNECK